MLTDVIFRITIDTFRSKSRYWISRVEHRSVKYILSFEQEYIRVRQFLPFLYDFYTRDDFLIMPSIKNLRYKYVTRRSPNSPDVRCHSTPTPSYFWGYHPLRGRAYATGKHTHTVAHGCTSCQIGSVPYLAITFVIDLTMFLWLISYRHMAVGDLYCLQSCASSGTHLRYVLLFAMCVCVDILGSVMIWKFLGGR